MKEWTRDERYRVLQSPVHTYQMAKRCNEKRVMAEAVKWASGVRGSTTSPPASS